MGQEQSVSRELPKWVPLSLVVLFVLAALLMVWWQWPGDSMDQVVTVLPETRPARAPIQRDRFTAALPAPGVHEERPGAAWRVRSAQASMWVFRQNGGEPSFHLIYNNPNLLTSAAREAILAREQALRNATMAHTAGLGPEQVSKLKAIKGGNPGEITLTATERGQLKSLWLAYESAQTKAPAEKTLLAAMDEMAARTLEPAKASLAARAAQIAAILTPAQIKQINDLARSARPATTPVKK